MTENQGFDVTMSVLSFQGNKFSVREGNYWDATLMCQAYGKRVHDFLRNDSIKRFLNASAKVLQLEIEAPLKEIAQKRALIYKAKGGDVDGSGTWFHRRVALRLAAWLNEDFEAWVYGSIEELLLVGKVELNDIRLKELSEALSLEQVKTKQLSECLTETTERLAEATEEIVLLSESLTEVAEGSILLAHDRNQLLYQLNSAGLLQPKSDDEGYMYDWEVDVSDYEDEPTGAIASTTAQGAIAHRIHQETTLIEIIDH